MQRDVAHRDAADEHRLEARDGRECAGAAHLELDVAHRRRLFLRRELVRDGPARRAGDEAEVALPVEPVDLVDDAVDVVAELVTLAANSRVVLETAGHALDDVDLRTRAQSERAQRREHLAVQARRFPALRGADAVEVEVERAARGDRRVELPEAARGGIARIGERLLAHRRLAAVQAVERAPRHEHLAAHLEQRRCAIADETQRHGADRADVRRDVLAFRPVAASRGLHEAAVLVTQADGEAVDLGLRGVSDLLHVETFADAPVEVDDVLVAEGVVERQHRHGVHDLGELARDGAAHPLGGRIRRHEIRVGALEFAQLAEERVVARVGDLGIVEDVIAVVVVLDLAPEFGDPPFKPRGGHRGRVSDRPGRGRRPASPRAAARSG